MPGRATMDDETGYDGMAEPTLEFGDETDSMLLASLADSIVGTAADPDEALDMCRDLASAENLDGDQFLDLIGLVERGTGWELPEEGEGL